MVEIITPPQPAPLRLRIWGDLVLRKKAKPVAAITAEIRQLAAEMVETMYTHHGVGLAAPQIGRSLRLIIIDTRIGRDLLPPDPSPGDILLAPRMPLPLVNPEVIRASKALETCSEGCLSVTKVYADVTRPAAVVLRATTLEGETFEVECDGLLGRCVQHEIDHLDGILFPDRLSREELRKVETELAGLEKTVKRRRPRPT